MTRSVRERRILGAPGLTALLAVVGPLENARRIFLDYLRDINELRERPRFYNTLTTNCTTMILAHATVNPGHIPFSFPGRSSSAGTCPSMPTTWGASTEASPSRN